MKSIPNRDFYNHKDFCQGRIYVMLEVHLTFAIKSFINKIMFYETHTLSLKLYRVHFAWVSHQNTGHVLEIKYSFWKLQ